MELGGRITFLSGVAIPMGRFPQTLFHLCGVSWHEAPLAVLAGPALRFSAFSQLAPGSLQRIRHHIKAVQSQPNQDLGDSSSASSN